MDESPLKIVTETECRTRLETPSDVLVDLPKGLPVPEDDGACAHLEGCRLPAMDLISSSGGLLDPSTIAGWVVIFCYPMTGRPGRAVPDAWADLPGAAGCTPQACSFRDRHPELVALSARLLGISTQSPEDQREAAQRLRLPFPLLSDESRRFAQALHLPMFEIDRMRLLKRVTLIARDGLIVKCFYPVFPPDRNIDDVLECLRRRSS